MFQNNVRFPERLLKESIIQTYKLVQKLVLIMDTTEIKPVEIPDWMEEQQQMGDIFISADFLSTLTSYFHRQWG